MTDRWQLNPYTSLNTTAVYHREDDSVDITDGVDLEMALAYTRNYLSLELVVEYDLLEIDRNMDGKGLGVFVRVRRDCGHLFSNRRGFDDSSRKGTSRLTICLLAYGDDPMGWRVFASSA
ncbi:MAG: hypothetical protein R3E58_17640 [Phycisphaerae bacterium]